MMSVSVAVLVFAIALVGAAANNNCTLVRESMLKSAFREVKMMGMDSAKLAGLVKFSPGSGGVEGRRDVWRGAVKGMDIVVFDVDDDLAPLIQVNPVAVENGLRVEITIKRYADVNIKELAGSMSKSLVKKQSNVCASDQAMAYYGSSVALLNPLVEQREVGLQGVGYCIVCASVLGITLPIILNLMLGEGFTKWCINNTDAGEAQCDDWSIMVVLAMEMPIVILGGVIVAELCFGPDCTPSVQGTAQPKVLL